ncbi:MAG: hypothetical protein CMM10_18395 [Rhodospirillaceae bacterium]|jgi:outer membrane lipoprotein SlyB|nr:hypothetical protein [Rhodospirillaceae bacterium]MDP6642620.1 hypothetical protein [Rhodospirillales bacterium]
MNSEAVSTPEVVGTIADKAQLDETVAALKTAGFDSTDLSLLSSHDSLATLEGEGKHWKDAVTALAGEYTVLGPLAVSGGIILAGGPAAATIAGIVGAAVGGMALIEVVHEAVTEADADNVSRALEAGSVIIWVRAASEERGATARRVLQSCGASNIRITG